MKKTVLISSALLLGIFLLGSCSKTPEDNLVRNIGKASTQELSQLTFFELNILKNSVFSLQGYAYAKDRPWLYAYFYEYTGNETSDEKWDMSKYQFAKPGSVEEIKFDEDMKRAIANVRVALYQKIRAIKSITALDETLQSEYQNHGGKVFGRKVQHFTEFVASQKQELHGLKRIISIIDGKSNFDAGELLGVYLGNIVMLKNVIEAQNGKKFDGTLGWEISQLVGITPTKEGYARNNLPDGEKLKLDTLDAVIDRVKKSGIGDLPSQLRTKGIGIGEHEIIKEEAIEPREPVDPSAPYAAAC